MHSPDHAEEVAEGFRYPRELQVGSFLEVEAVNGWSHEPAPPMSHILFVDWDVDGPVDTAPITQAESAVELRRHSYNLRRSRINTWAVLQRVLRHTSSFRMMRSQDLNAAATAIRHLVDSSSQGNSCAETAAG